jgi:hypothetical protein
MKNLLIIILVAIVQLCSAKTTTVSFYFNDQISTLSRTQLDSIIQLALGKRVVKVVGYANSIPNYTTGQPNEELAYDRGLYLSEFLNVSLESNVINSTSRSDQRVDIYIEDKIDLNIKQNNILEKIEEQNINVVNNQNTTSTDSINNTINKINSDIIYIKENVYFCDCNNKSIDELKQYSFNMYKMYKNVDTDINIRESALLCYRQTRRYINKLKNDYRRGRYIKLN